MAAFRTTVSSILTLNAGLTVTLTSCFASFNLTNYCLEAYGRTVTILCLSLLKLVFVSRGVPPFFFTPVLVSRYFKTLLTLMLMGLGNGKQVFNFRQNKLLFTDSRPPLRPTQPFIP